MGRIQSKIIVLVRKKVITITVMIVAIALCLAVLLYRISVNDYEKTLLVNTLGKQRMLTQMLAKNASRVYVLIQALESGEAVESTETIKERISQVKAEIALQEKEFDSVLSHTHRGSMVIEGKTIDFSDSLKDIEVYLAGASNIWLEFKASLDILLVNGSIDEKVTRAIMYINTNNEKLLEYCDKINGGIVGGLQGKRFKDSTLAVLMFLLATAVIALSLQNLYKYIIVPLNQVYKSISELGAARGDFGLHMPTGKEIEPVLEEINDVFLKLKRLLKLIENINNNQSFDEVLEYIYTNFSMFIPYSYIGIALIKDEGEALEASYGVSDGTVSGLPDNLMGVKTMLKDTSLGKILETGNARIINDYEEYVRGKEIKDYTASVLEAGIKASITLPLKVNNRAVGVIFFSSKEKNVYTIEHIEILKTLANSLAISFEKNIFVDHLIYSSILALAKLAEARDEDTGDHLERMKKYSRLIAQLLYEDSRYKEQISPGYINDMEMFSPMHDIGKVGIPDGILLKPDKLTADEFEEMKYHTIYGARVLAAAEENMLRSGRSIFKLGIEIAKNHHERWNGLGYPEGLAGERIPLSARIVAVADVFDALTSKRPYKEPFPFEMSFNMVIEGSGKHFDPEIVRVFAQNKDRIFELYESFQRQEESGEKIKEYAVLY